MGKQVGRRGRIEHQPGLAAVVADQREAAVDVARCFRVKRDHIGAGLGERGDQRIDRFDHQVDVDGDINVRADGFADKRPDRQIGDVVVVHHIEMDPVSPGGHNVADLLAKAREVGG